ncbi:MAG: glycine betaine/L-proline ABC transporter substrate-binding protein ProX [Aurantimonas endophytica]|uniref:Glycine betaine/proline transport system substrate-binding protein n=1 Tax=Aurantimonas endophytica TaxID=1522175 RepID=A0A7W6MQV6_9HYPH|nr:glycine betaine/L-proline ABC transporter substrate-binding protein ProX [Aurantimonas endophytica]MBB4004385.1 glycine betaine/proline transport system substrate-binding protein [Aurantimonas endophytica]MCO6405223.1 glycine betaine/L-proline ABC transporter substrate-binding protein ProX [Aurantimonas endophytica]
MTIRTLQKYLATAGVAALALTAAAPGFAQDMPGDGVTVTMARPTWDTGWFSTEIYRQLLQKLGYEVTQPTTLDAPVFYQAVGQGDVTLWVEGWFPLHNTYESAFDGQAEKIGYVAKGGALQGYLVDKASAEEFDIKSLEDFKRPEVMEAFDRDGDGKADLVACPPGWGCEVTITHQLEAFDLNDSINAIKANYSASMADAIAAHEQGDPILFYTWTPNWTVDELKPGEDVVWIETPGVELPEDQMSLADAATVPGVQGCVADPCVMGWPANDIQPVANTEFLNENPAVRTLLEAASIPLEDIFAQNAAMNNGENSEEDIQKQAADWIESNKADTDKWLADARAAAN